MRTLCGTFPASVSFVLAAGILLADADRLEKRPAMADTPEERAARTEEIAAWLPVEPGSDGARIGNRAAWERLARMPGAADVVKKAEEVASAPIPALPDDLYLEFSRNGNRRNYEDAYFSRERALGALLLAECLENKGRFRSGILDYVNAILSERCWTIPAHDEKLTAFNGLPHVELMSAQRCCLLAFVCDWLYGVLPEETRMRIRDECDKRIFQPYLMLSRNFRNPAVRKTLVKNEWYDYPCNWCSVCHSCVVRAALAIIPDRRTRAEIVASAEYSVPFALAGYLSDGTCVEGMGYWNYGYGHHLMMGLAVRAATGGKVDFFKDPMNRKTCEWAYGFQLENGKSPNVADGTGPPSIVILSLVRQVFPDLVRRDVAECGLFSADGNRGINRQLPMYVALRGFGQDPGPDYSGGVDILPPRSWFPAAQTLICRAPVKDGAGGLSFAVKGGHNGVPHNHNDLGSYTLMLDGVEMGGDPGREVYTKRTFSNRRYESKVLNSYGHPVPVVAGRLQQAGRKFEAKVVKTDFAEDRDEIVYDLAKGYDVPGLKSLVRRMVFDRKGGTITIEDAVEFAEPSKFEVPYVTYRDYAKDEAARHFVLRHPNGGRSLALDVESSAPVVFRDEKIENPGFPTITRLGFSFAEPVTTASLKMTFRVGEGRTPRNARFTGLSAISTPGMTSESGRKPAKRLFPGGR